MQTIKELNYEAYMQEDLSQYLGEWIIIVEGKVVAHGKDISEVTGEAREKYPDKRFMIAKVPGNDTMIY